MVNETNFSKLWKNTILNCFVGKDSYKIMFEQRKICDLIGLEECVIRV